MSEQYRGMWSKLGLNLEAHDALLGVLGKAYQDIYLAQQNRPEGMKYFDFVMTEVHGLRVKELNDARAAGRKVIGSFCTFVPEELILAVNGISVGLCAGAEFAFDQAETLLPRNTCALIKSMFGFSLGKVCPYLESSDMIVGENTCDGKKKAYEEFGKLVKNLYVMDLPQMKSEAGKALLKAEYQKFIKALEALTGRKITAEGLKAGIKTANLKRKAMRRLVEARKADPAPISGLDALLANQLFFFDDPARFTESVNKLADEVEERAKKGKGAFEKGRPRVIVSGCPMAIPNWKLPMVIESAGAVVVGEESCVGERGARWMTSEDGNSVEALLDNIVDRYFQIDCAIFTPNQSRLDQVKKMVKDYHAQGVIHYCLQFCQPYQMETGNMVRELEKAGVPALAIETDYGQEDAGQLKTRIEAFLEMIK
jgi:benzoyl-CoA reductase/2-hydroxyglutaryl-CoA dehydratase subunit BcrC/BadD/HgdB